MHHRKGFERPPAWTDRFRSPTPADLRESLRAPVRPLYDILRKRLQINPNVREEIVWYGDCWHWSLEYRTVLSKEPLAVLIPAPHDLQLALPMDQEFTRSLPMQRLKRAVRDGLDLVQEPYQSRWGIWSVGAATIIDDLQDLIELKLAHLTKAAG